MSGRRSCTSRLTHPRVITQTLLVDIGDQVVGKGENILEVGEKNEEKVTNEDQDTDKDEQEAKDKQEVS